MTEGPLTFRPSLAELGDWEGLVATMERQGAHLTGVARLVMPEGWVARRKGYSPDTIPLTIASPLTQRILPTEVQGAFDHHVERRHRAPLTVPEFHRLASSPPHLPPPGTPRHLERLYWARPLTAAPPPVYGADVAASLMDADQPVFNLDRLNSGRQAVLFHDQGPELGGIHTPYLFFGMWGATFSWHVEDMDLYGLNYHHHGAAKQWYVVPPSQAHQLERLARRLFPRDAAVCHNLLRHKSVLLQPALLERNGVTVHRVLQRAGQAIVVFPSAYHAGFNHGYNVAEAINFGTERWLEYGMRARGCRCAGRGEAVRIDMTPLLAHLRPAAAWRAGEDFGLHPEDPPALAAFLAHATERFARGKVTEGEMAEITRELREFATIPAWYGRRFGVKFEEEEKLVALEEEGEGWDKARRVGDIALMLREVEEVNRSSGKLNNIDKKGIKDTERKEEQMNVRKMRIEMQKKIEDINERNGDEANASEESEGSKVLNHANKELENAKVKESRPEEVKKKETKSEEEGEEESKLEEAVKEEPVRRSPVAAPAATVECSLCRLEFSASLLRRHSRLAHRVPCEEPGCGAMVESAAHLAAHTRRVHRRRSAPWLLQCVACGQERPPGPGFEEHRHTPHPHNCSHCDLVFVKESELVRHIVKEHSQQGKGLRKPGVGAEKSLKHWGEEERSKEYCEEKEGGDDVDDSVKNHSVEEEVAKKNSKHKEEVENGSMELHADEEKVEEKEEENEDENRVCRQHREVEEMTAKQSQEGSEEQSEQKENEVKEPSEEEDSEENAEGESWAPSEEEEENMEPSHVGDVKEDSVTVKRRKQVAENIQAGVPVVRLEKIDTKAAVEASLNNRKRACVTEAQQWGKNFGFSLDAVMVTTESKRMKFLHLSSEVQVVILGQHVSIDCPRKIVARKIFKCQEPDCKAEFDRSEKVGEHMRRAHGEPRLVCPMEGCTITFISKKGVIRHRKTVHLIQPHLECPVEGCNMTFTYKNSLVCHRNTVHLKLKKKARKARNARKTFKCQVEDCEARLDRSEKVEDHMRQAHGEPKLLCDVEGCGRKFICTASLRKHMKTSHEE